ncbi:MAG: hypothetical protein JXR32_03000 [Anaerolineaceae bacterium]|nr:hypothetical protein [Anaerolineaceae bacterium]
MSPGSPTATGRHRHIRDVVLLWLAWVVILSAFQFWVTRRINLIKTDSVLAWTASDMSPDFLAGKLYLTDPFLNEHAAWDSEYYLSIAMAGYNDPEIRGVPAGLSGNRYQVICMTATDPDCISLNYAFFPLYPKLMRIMAAVMAWLPINPVARFTLAGVLISLLGTLAAMLALNRMTDDRDGLRTASYLIFFPSSMFLTQVYTEGLFLGLSFSAFACLHHRKWLPSAILAVLAVWTRPGGALLLLPMTVVWLTDRSWRKGLKNALRTGSAALAPLISYLAWSLSPLATKFHLVEARFFSRGFIDIPDSIRVWTVAIQSMGQSNLQRVFYYGIEIAAVILAICACIILLKERPETAVYGLALIGFAVLSGSAQGMVRYVLAVPALFIVVSRWGRHTFFDRIWVLTSCLLMGLLALLFSFNYWVG